MIIILIGGVEVGSCEIGDAVGDDFKEVSGGDYAGLLFLLLWFLSRGTESLFKHSH